MGIRAPHDTQDQHAAWTAFLGRMHYLLNADDSKDALMSEVSPKYLGLGVGAMLVSFHKYGAVGAGFPEHVDAIGAGALETSSDAQREQLQAAFKLLGSLGKRLNWYFFGLKNPDYVPGNGEKEYDIEPGNAEYLVDAGNYFAIEFMHPAHPAPRYEATDRWGSPGRSARNQTVLGGEGNQNTNRDLAAVSEAA